MRNPPVLPPSTGAPHPTAVLIDPRQARVRKESGVVLKESEQLTDMRTEPAAESLEAAPAPTQEAQSAADVAQGGVSEPDPVVEGGRTEEVRCQMKVMTDGSSEECDHPGIAPWLASGAGGLMLAMMSITRSKGGGDAGGKPPVEPPERLIHAPQLSTSTGGDAINDSGHVQVQLAAPDRRWVYRVDDDTQWHEGTGTRIDGSTLSDGMHAVVVAQVDEQGRRGEPATLAVMIDNAAAAPALALKQDTGSSAVDGVTREGVVSVSGLESGALWWYRLDGAGEWMAGQGKEIALGSDRQGPRSVEVYQIDPAGNRSETAQLSFTLDSVAPPVLSIDTSTGKSQVGVNDLVTIGGLEPGARWEYSIGDDPTYRAGDGESLPSGVLKEGVNVLRVVQVDAAGNRSVVAERTIDYDTTAPDGLLLTSSNPVGPINADGGVLVAGIEPGATWFFRVNGAETWTRGVGSTVPASALIEGVNVVEAYQVDGVGLMGPRVNASVALDLTPPQAPELQSSNGTDLLNAAGFVNVTGLEPGATWAYRLNGQGEWIDGQGGRIPASALSNGDNAIEVRQTDAAGNVGTAAQLRMRVDLDAPDQLAVHVEGGKPEALSMQGALVLDQLETGATWRYRINGESDWHVGSADRLAASALNEGTNVVEFFQTDSTGHEGAVSVITVTRDSTAPDRPDLVTSNGLPMINAQGSLLVHLLENGASWEYRVDGGAWTAGQGDVIASSALKEGDNLVEVRQTDAAGNVSAVDALSVQLDSVAPDALQATARAKAGTVAANALINATGYLSLENLEADATWQFRVQGDERWRNGSGTQMSTRVLDEGHNTIELRQIDAAGNAGQASAIGVDLDTIAPDAPVFTGPTLANYGVVQIAAGEPGDVLQVLLNGQRFDAGRQSQIAYYFMKEGGNTINATWTDAAGNVSSTAVFTATRDSTSPAPPSGVFVNRGGVDSQMDAPSDFINISGVEPGATWWYRKDGSGGAWIQGQGSSIMASEFDDIIGIKSRSVEIVQRDVVGNESPHIVLNFWSNFPPPAGI